jgi:hypothetical protein
MKYYAFAVGWGLNFVMMILIAGDHAKTRSAWCVLDAIVISNAEFWIIHNLREWFREWDARR